ncbi:MAG: M16 family metallopeptidase [Candidatus Aminicenantia bacterium]
MKKYLKIISLSFLIFITQFLFSQPLVKFEKFELPNGLKVILSEDHSSPIIGYAIYYNVGSRNEVKGRTGFAHLFEHMMFQGSENVPRNMHHIWIGRAGGNDNGSTSQDGTNYFATIPSNQLELALWLESDRMRSLKITRENFENQRATVKEEKKQSYDNQPYSEGRAKLYELVFESFPYRHTVIGSMEDLDDATVEDAKEFFNIYYAPNNAVLAIVGDFYLSEAKRLVEKYFGSIPACVPPPSIVINEPEREREKKLTLVDKYANMPAVFVGYGIPKRGEKDTYALELLGNILFSGESSRIFQKLVREEELAISVSGGANPMRGIGIFTMNMMIRPNRTPEQALQVALEEIEKIKKEYVKPEELKKVKSRLKRNFINRLENCLSRAMLLCEFELYDGDANLINSELEKYMVITEKEISEVAERYLTAKNRAVVTVLPYSYRPPDESFRKNLPFNEKPIHYKFPFSKEKVLSKGLAIQVFENRALPKITAQFSFKGGAYYEPAGKTGISQLLANLMRTGSKNYASETLQEKLEILGASLDISSGPDRITVTTTSFSENWKEVLNIIADVIMNPSFDENELRRQVRNLKARILQQRSSPLFLASEMLYKKVFKEHPYSKISTPSGAPYVNIFQILADEKFLNDVKKEEIYEYHKKFFIPNETLLFAVGDFKAEEFFSQIEKVFGAWKKGPSIKDPQYPQPEVPSKRVLYLVDRPGSIQSYILIGNLLFPRNSKDYIPLMVGNKILGGGRHIGGGGTGRLFMNLREEKGWTYGCYSWVMPFVHSGIFAINAEVRTEVTASAVREIMKEIERLRKGDATEEDLKYAKSFLSGVLPLVSEGATGIINAATTIKINNLPSNYWDTYPQLIKSVTFEEMNKAVEKNIHLKNAIIVVVGDAKKIESEVKPLCDEILKFDTKGKRI